MSYDGVEIFPPIGICRAGDSTDGYYKASEDPNQEFPNNYTLRDDAGKIKPSAVTFHAYLVKGGKPIKEATSADYTLKWTVDVANKKAAWVRFKGIGQQESFRLRNPRVNPYDPEKHKGVYEHTENRNKLIIQNKTEILAGQHTANNPKILTGDFEGSNTGKPPTKVDLGKIWTDADGCLVFLAGTGEAKCVKQGNPHPDLLGTFDNDDWYDTLCDGNISVEVGPKLNEPMPFTSTLKTIVISAAPKFTNGLRCITSLYDVIEDVYERPRRHDRHYDCGEVYYDSDIRPIIDSVHLMSWTNLKANEGHGPHKADRFPHDLLLNVDEKYNPLRQSILARIRLPNKVDDPANKFARNEQATEYYMPRLGGDSGDNPEAADHPNDRDKWATLTQLQYDRLTKWAQGSFKPGTRFEGVDTPRDLTRAALKWTTGAPLFPGIEAYWVVKLSSMYHLPVDAKTLGFRFHNSVRAGDLTKGLSLPWQADFYMCNTHWWPYIRPDDIVTQETWEKAKALVKATNPGAAVPTDGLTKRSLWHNGLQTHPDDERVGSTEMIKKWNKLGFISRIQTDPVVFIETERTLIREGIYSIASATSNRYVGCTATNDKRPVTAVALSQIWHIKYIEPLRSNLYRLTIADFTAAADDGTNVNAYTASNRNWNEWFIESTAKKDEYTISITIDKKKKYWTLGGGDPAAVTVTEEANGFANQIWKLVPYKPMYKISNQNSNQDRVVGCTNANGQERPIGVVSSQTWHVDHVKGDRYHLIIADYAAAVKGSDVYGYKIAPSLRLSEWVINPEGAGYTIATVPVGGSSTYWTLVDTQTQVTVAAKNNLPNQIWKLVVA